MSRLFFIHGYGGSPEDERFTSALMELEKKGFAVHAPAMPETDHPRKDAWVRALRGAVGTPDGETFVIGFSLGCITILRYLEELGKSPLPSCRPKLQRRLVKGEGRVRVASTLLLSGFFEDLGPDFIELRSFIDVPVDWIAVKRSCPEFTVVHGDDDPLVPLPFAQRLAKNLDIPLRVEHGVGHFNTAYGVKRVGEIIREWACRIV